MITTVASGKGGTGKTTVAVSLALSLVENAQGRSVSHPLFLDCDVEAPNDALFLRPMPRWGWTPRLHSAGRAGGTNASPIGLLTYRSMT